MSNEIFDPAISYSLERARELIDGAATLVLTGAGISTSSGIPDYRGEGRVQRHPLTFDEFMTSPSHQARYWARSYVGFNRIAAAEPNPGHFAIARAEQTGKVHHIITQNVDGLHQKAGATKVVELHGRLDRINCTGCGKTITRSEMDDLIRLLNPGVEKNLQAEFAPDGDADIEVPAGFQVPHCVDCESHFKPDVVFFGEQVPLTRVELANSLVDSAGAMLVAGSSLTVNSGLRLVKRAKAREIPVVIVNLGETKADAIADVKINASTTDLLGALFD